MKTKTCPCRETFSDSHGNSVYCPGENCENEARKLRSKERYAAISMKADPLWLNEKILRDCYNKNGPKTELDPNELDALGFDFELTSEERNVDGILIFCMKNFGFSFLKNKNIIIWKLK